MRSPAEPPAATGGASGVTEVSEADVVRAGRAYIAGSHARNVNYAGIAAALAVDRARPAAPAPPLHGICPAHGERPVRWIEGAHRCDVCGEACGAATYAGTSGPRVDYLPAAPAPRAEAAGVEDLAELRALHEAATPAPWAWAQTAEKGHGANIGAECFADDDDAAAHALAGDLSARDDYDVGVSIAELWQQQAATNAALIVAMRNGLPALLARLAEAQATVVALETFYRAEQALREGAEAERDRLIQQDGFIRAQLGACGSESTYALTVRVLRGCQDAERALTRERDAARAALAARQAPAAEGA